MNRRRFLLLLLAAAVAGLAPRVSAARKPKGRRKRVVVIGAGISGIAAARELTRSGVAVTVLEARNRLGGRIHSDRSLGAAVDLGASWIHGVKGNPITELARKLGLRTFASDEEESETFDAGGTVISGADERAWMKRLGELEDALEEYAGDLRHDVSWAAAIRHVLEDEEVTPREARFLENFKTGLETESGASVDRLSFLHSEEDESFGGGDRLFPNGYSQLVEALARPLDVRLNTMVSAIDHGHSRVVVHAGKETVEADAVLVTVPLGVLKRGGIAFSPALPADKTEAISRLGMGVLNKVALRFPRVAWPRDLESFEYASGVLRQGPVSAERCTRCHEAPSPRETGDFTEFHSLVPVNGAPILIAFAGGPLGYRMEAWADDEIVDRVVRVLRTILGASLPGPTGHAISRWHNDPFAGGAYPHVPVGATPADLDVLAEPVGARLFFAGDGTTSDYLSTVHGAYLSGLREAERIAVADL